MQQVILVLRKLYQRAVDLVHIVAGVKLSSVCHFGETVI